ncbi:MAG: hypothetical protein MK212_11105 [Saprospiraceae bacterium]|nr:hypothetical protein [Saprospiraceae bacterium]
MFILHSIDTKSTDWEYVNLSNELLSNKYNWVHLKMYKDHKYPWAHVYDMERLFIFLVSYHSAKEVFSVLEQEAYSLNTIHQNLINFYSYPQEIPMSDLDDLIEDKVLEPRDLFQFIAVVMDRAILWFEPGQSWVGYFRYIVYECFRVLPKLETVKLVDEESRLDLIKTEEKWSIDDWSMKETAIFYRLKNMIEEIKLGQLSYDLVLMAKQAFSTLLESILLFFDYRQFMIEGHESEHKLDQIFVKEKQWCKAYLGQLLKRKKQLTQFG